MKMGCHDLAGRVCVSGHINVRFLPIKYHVSIGSTGGRLLYESVKGNDRQKV